MSTSLYPVLRVCVRVWQVVDHPCMVATTGTNHNKPNLTFQNIIAIGRAYGKDQTGEEKTGNTNLSMSCTPPPYSEDKKWWYKDHDIYDTIPWHRYNSKIMTSILYPWYHYQILHHHHHIWDNSPSPQDRRGETPTLHYIYIQMKIHLTQHGVVPGWLDVFKFYSRKHYKRPCTTTCNIDVVGFFFFFLNNTVTNDLTKHILNTYYI